MSNLKRYPEYKDSGVPWLGEIPSHWEVIDTKYILNFSRGLTITKSDLIDEGIPCVNYGEVHSKYGFEVDPAIHSLKCVPESYLNDFEYAILEKGDFVFADTSEDYEGSGNFTYLNSDIITFAGYHTVVAKLKVKQFPRYLAYIFDSTVFRAQVRNKVSGVKVFSITHNILKNTSVWLPPIDEQNIIVSFLDKKLNHIDTLISKQERLLDKLAEQRSAVITHAVTKGLDPTAPMKDSGVEWLGEIPEHWSVCKLSRLFIIKAGGDLKEKYFSEHKSADFIYPIYTNSNKPDDVYGYTSKSFFPANSITVSGRGYIGYAVYRDHPFDAIIRLLVLNPISMLDGRFYAYLINNVLDFTENSSAVAQLSTNQIAPYKVPKLSFEEQKEIADFLDKKTMKIDQIVSITKNTIAKLKEYRSALITQAVTGKIDVRDMVEETKGVA